MRATRYTKRITVQTPTKAENDIAGWTNTWTDLYCSWASVVQMKGFKKLQYGMNANEEVYEVEMRRRLINVDVDCRIVYGGNNYQIIGTPVITDDRVNLEMSRTI